jgi:hypothetical protein
VHGLFDAGSVYTIIQRASSRRASALVEESSKPVKLYLVNGRFAEADKYARVTSS